MKYFCLKLLMVPILTGFLSGCFVAAHGPYGRATVVDAPPPAVKPGPPPHAKAYGYRAKHHYHYYPDSRVYFDTGRQVYFYLEDGSWTMAVSLPTYLRVSLGSRVSLEMELDRPYVHYEEHRKKYPGKKHRHKHKQKRKGRGKYKKKYDDD